MALVVVEIIFVPGTTIVGILGLAAIIAGLVFTFSSYGNTAGWSVTGGTAVFSTVTLIYAFRSGAWSRFALKGTINSKVNENKPILVKIGDEGVTHSTLRPMGKGEFDNVEMEVRSLGQLVPTNSKIRIIKIDNRKIFVEPINN